MASKVYDMEEALMVEQKVSKHSISCKDMLQMKTCFTMGVSKLSYRFNLSCLPVWKSRFLVITDGFIFKYSGPNGLFVKGVPIDLCNYSVTTEDLTLTLTSLSKSYVFRCEKLVDLQNLEEEIEKQKNWRIKQRLGHIVITDADQRIIAFAERHLHEKERVNLMLDRNMSENINYVDMYHVCNHIISMRNLLTVLSIVACLLVFVGLKTHTKLVANQIDSYPDRLIKQGRDMNDFSKKHGPAYRTSSRKILERKNVTNGQFTVIIVTFNELLLEKTVNNVLENTDHSYIKEILIIDDHSDIPVEWDPNEPLVRIIRNERRMGLIGARFIGGNNALGDYLAFIDAHVFVGPNWLKTPKRILEENPKTVVNYLNFNLDKDRFLPMKAWQGLGSSATITMDLRQIWGGGSRQDPYSPITMGMFVISKYWWNQGAMDPALRTWGGENVEISFRTWLCGGQIVVAKDSFVAHGFRTKFPYSVNGADILRNYIRIANVWMDEHHLKLFYNASRIPVINGRPKYDPGDISDRLLLKKQLNCKPFSYYAEKFAGRALCLPKHMRYPGYRCGDIMTVSPRDISYLTYEQMFFKNATMYICLFYILYNCALLLFI